jgi:hypothetical protein
MDARDMSVPVGFLGEHRKISFIDGSASIVFFTCILVTLRVTMFNPRTEIKTYVIHTQAETSLFSSFSSFRREFKVYLDDADVVGLRAYCIHAIHGWYDKDLLASWRNADAHEKIDDLVRPDSKENMIRARQAA